MTTLFRCHSSFSLLEALPAPPEIALAAQAGGFSGAVLTDHLYLTGAVEFQQASLQLGMHSILGLEIDLEPPGTAALADSKPGRLALLATGPDGWANLCRLSTHLLTSGEPGTHTSSSWELLAAHGNGLLCLSGGPQGLLDRWLDQGHDQAGRDLLGLLNEIFPGRLYVELTATASRYCGPLADLNRLAGKMGLPVVASSAVFSLHPEQDDLLQTLAAIRLNRSRASLRTEMDPACSQIPGAHIPNLEHWKSTFQDYPQAMTSCQEITERCQYTLPVGTTHFPRLALPEGKSAIELLRQKAITGARRIYGVITPQIQERLDHEIATIAHRGYEPIFLIMEEILNFARQQGVPFASRGSAASSLVAHCLAITDPDPLQLDLYFERFLNPVRTTPPDIDTDLCSRRRDEVIQHVFDTYGAQQVAMVGTINRFRPRSALGDVAKAYGLHPDQVRTLVNSLPHHYFHGDSGEDAGRYPKNPFQDLMLQYPAPHLAPVFQDALAVLGQPRHLSIHPGGVVISPGPMTDLVPVFRSGSKGIWVTQFDLDSIEKLGLVKIDLLGIRGLTVLGEVSQSLYSWRRSEYRSSSELLESIPLADVATGETVRTGKTIGCFQIESPGMRATLKEIQAQNPGDILAALALYRPGPLKGGLKDAYVRRHKGLEQPVHLHPALAPLLEDTYGVILYQEQVLRIAHSLAGLSLAEADLLRRAMSHFDPGKQMQVLKEKFIAGAGEKNGVDEETAARVWELMAAFAGYGFPKAHAASYAMVAWRSAWCKTYYPAEFMAAVLANWGGYYSQRVYISEARRMGLHLHAPHINHSQREFRVAYINGEPELYMGLDQVRDLTRRAQERILQRRPFHSVEEFLVRVDPRPQEAENLARVGAFEKLGSIPEVLEQIKEGWRPGQMSLFQASKTCREDWSLEQKMSAQEALLGTSVVAHPLELFSAQINAAGVVTTLEAAAHPGRRVRVAGVRQTLRRAAARSQSGRSQTMAFLSLEDLEGTLDVVIFPDVYQKSRQLLSSTRPLLVEGSLEYDAESSEPVLHAERIVLLT